MTQGVVRIKTTPCFYKEMEMPQIYIAAIYDTRTQNALREWCVDNNFDLEVGFSGEPQSPEKFEFHTTIFYTSNDITSCQPYPGYRTIESYKVEPIKVDFLGENKDIPVLKLAPTGALISLRKGYEQQGFEDKWDSYIPHISLSYAKTQIDVTGIRLPDFPITFNYIKVEDVV